MIPILRSIESERDRIREIVRQIPKTNPRYFRLLEMNIRLNSMFYQIVDMYDVEREFRHISPPSTPLVERNGVPFDKPLSPKRAESPLIDLSNG